MATRIWNLTLRDFFWLQGMMAGFNAAYDCVKVFSETDMTEAISRFQTLQTSLQASMQTSASILNLSLLDFLS